MNFNSIKLHLIKISKKKKSKKYFTSIRLIAIANFTE